MSMQLQSSSFRSAASSTYRLADGHISSSLLVSFSQNNIISCTSSCQVPLCLYDPADLVHNYNFNSTTDLILLFPQHCKSSLATKCISLFFHFHFFICLLHQVLNLLSCVYVENWVILDFEPGSLHMFWSTLSSFHLELQENIFKNK
jgi:hypothetical protein